MANKAQEQYEKHHKEFETWWLEVHPNAELSEWVSSWDCGYYERTMTQGAWIAWLALTGKRNW